MTNERVAAKLLEVRQCREQMAERRVKETSLSAQRSERGREAALKDLEQAQANFRATPIALLKAIERLQDPATRFAMISVELNRRVREVNQKQEELSTLERETTLSIERSEDAKRSLDIARSKTRRSQELARLLIRKRLILQRKLVDQRESDLGANLYLSSQRTIPKFK